MCVTQPGPNNDVLVTLGAKYAPCMRNDGGQRDSIRKKQATADASLGMA